MPGFTPGRRWQPAYSPFKKENFGDRALQVLEYSVEGSAVWLPHVRELPFAGDGVHLPDGMPKGFAERSLRRLHTRTLLCG